MAKKNRASREPAVLHEAEAEGLEDLIALDQVIAALETQRRAKLADLIPLFFSFYFEHPTVRTFRVAEGRASAVCTLRRRASNRPLAADQLLGLAKYRISAKMGRTKTRLNPAHADNDEVMKTLARVVADARRAGVDLPADLFVQNDAGAVVTDDAVRRVLALRGPDALRLIQAVSDVSLSDMSMSGGDPLRYAAEVVERMLDETEKQPRSTA